MGLNLGGRRGKKNQVKKSRNKELVLVEICKIFRFRKNPNK